jgi:hypothetical protein
VSAIVTPEVYGKSIYTCVRLIPDCIQDFLKQMCHQEAGQKTVTLLVHRQVFCEVAFPTLPPASSFDRTAVKQNNFDTVMK